MRQVVSFPSMLLTEVLQRPDDAIHRGLDKTTELDMSKSGNFISNFEPLTREQAWSRTHLYLWKSIDIIASLIDSRRILHAGSRPRRRHHRLPEVHVADADAPPRLPRRRQAHLLRVLGPPPHRRRQAFQEPPLPSGCPGLANMLASRTVAGPDLTGVGQDLTNPRAYYIGVMGARLARKLPLGDPVHFPVTAVLCGRRNNAPEPHSTSHPPLSLRYVQSSLQWLSD